MKALKYHLLRTQMNAANVLTELVNNTQHQLNEAEPVQGDRQPYWELADTIHIDDGELLFVFACWDGTEERF